MNRSTFNYALIVVIAVILYNCMFSTRVNESNKFDYNNSPIPIDSNANIDSSFGDNNYSTLIGIVDRIKLNGNSCDSISGARISVIDGAWIVSCNNSRYEYEFRDIGGKLEFKVIR